MVFLDENVHIPELNSNTVSCLMGKILVAFERGFICQERDEKENHWMNGRFTIAIYQVLMAILNNKPMLLFVVFVIHSRLFSVLICRFAAISERCQTHNSYSQVWGGSVDVWLVNFSCRICSVCSASTNPDAWPNVASNLILRWAQRRKFVLVCLRLHLDELSTSAYVIDPL